MTELQAPYHVGDPWCCKHCLAVLGYRVRKDLNGRHIETLVTLAGPELIGFGYVPCECGETREWQPGEAAMELLIKRYGKLEEHHAKD